MTIPYDEYLVIGAIDDDGSIQYLDKNGYSYSYPHENISYSTDGTDAEQLRRDIARVKEKCSGTIKVFRIKSFFQVKEDNTHNRH